MRLSKQYIREARYVIALDFASVIGLKILAMRLTEMMPGRVGSCDVISITRVELSTSGLIIRCYNFIIAITKTIYEIG